MAFFEKPM